MSSIENQIAARLAADEVDYAGAEELIDAHLDEVSGGNFSLHIQFGGGGGGGTEPTKPAEPAA